jgi:hypothetical protein
MATISFKQFFRNVFYIMLTLAAVPYMLLSTFLSLFMEVPIVSLSMEVYLPGYDLMPKYEEDIHQDEDEDEDEDEEEEDENSEEQNEDSEKQNEDSEDESVKVVHTTPTLAPINVENHDNMTNSGHCTPVPRHNSEPTIPDSPIKRRPTDIEDEIVIDSTARTLVEDFNNMTTVDLPTIVTPPPSVDENTDSAQIEEVTGVDDTLKQEPSESSSSVNDE